MKEIRDKGALLIAVLLIVSSVAPFVGVAGAVSGMTTIPDSNISENVPQHARDKMAISAGDLQGSTMTSHGAETLEVSITTEAAARGKAAACSRGNTERKPMCDSFALNLTDNSDHSGRKVAIPKAAIKAELGYVPAFAYIRNSESGEQYRKPIQEDGSAIVFNVKHFSTNTVSFESEVSVSATPAKDGTSIQYELSSTDGVSDLVINTTGEINAETDNSSYESVKNGDALGVNIGGNLAPDGSVTLTGEISPGAQERVYQDSSTTFNEVAVDTSTGTIFVGYSSTVSAIDADTGDYLWNYTGHSNYITGLAVDESSGTLYSAASTTSGLHAIDIGTGSADWTYSQHSSDVKGVTVDESTDTVYSVGYGGEVHSVDSSGSQNWVYTEPDAVYSVTVDESTGNIYTGNKDQDVVAIDPAGNYLWTYAGHSGAVYGVAVNETSEVIYSAGGDNEVHAIDSSGSQIWTYTGHSNTVNDVAVLSPEGLIYSASSDNEVHAIDPNGSRVWTYTGHSGAVNGISLNQSGRMAYSAGANSEVHAFTAYTAAKDPSIDIDGDGQSEVSYSGTLSARDSYTTSVSPSLSDESWQVVLSEGAVDIDISISERTETKDPAVEVNGHWTNHTGTLSDGETVSLATNDSWIQDGTNKINISVGDGSLSADAPNPVVDLQYRHNATDKQSVSYAAEQWSESYNVSKTFASERDQATLTVPYASEVVAIRNLDAEINDSGTWNNIASSDYSLDGTTLTVDLDQVYGGTIPANTSIAVRTTGSRVDTHNISITVVDPSLESEDLDSKIRVDSKDTGAYIDVGPTPAGPRIHYTASETWSDPSEYVVVTGSGQQKLHVPGAANGDTFRVRHVSTKASLDSGDAKIAVVDAGASPEFEVGPGPGGKGDTVELTYYNTEDGTTYLLQEILDDSKSLLDSAVANSPVTLSMSDDSRLVGIFEGSSSSGDDSGDDDGGGGTGGISVGSSLFVVVSVVVLGGVWFVSQQFGSGRISTRTFLLLSGGVVLVFGLEILSGALVSGLISFLTSTVSALFASLSQAWPIAILVAGGLGYLWLKNRGKPKKEQNIIVQAVRRGNK